MQTSLVSVDACVGVLGGMVVAESRRPSGRYTVRTAEEAARPWVGVAGA
ncbi:hypothetical protein [Salinispora arenicola]|nr:hypothetical protein [Salinispora arenicola]